MMDGKYIKPRCKSNSRIAEALTKAAAITIRAERIEEGKASNKALAEKTIKMKAIMMELLGINEEKLIISHENIIPTSRAIMYKELQECGYSLPKIGGAFCKDHSSVMSAIRMVNGLLEYGDAGACELYAKFKERYDSDNCERDCVAADRYDTCER